MPRGVVLAYSSGLACGGNCVGRPPYAGRHTSEADGEVGHLLLAECKEIVPRRNPCVLCSGVAGGGGDFS